MVIGELAPIMTPEPGKVILKCKNIGTVTMSGKIVCDKCGLFWYDKTNTCYESYVMWKELRK